MNQLMKENKKGENETMEETQMTNVGKQTKERKTERIK